MDTHQCTDHFYLEILKPFSSDEIALITQIKRFFEWVQGDPEFSEAVCQNSITEEQRARLKNIGVLFDPDGLLPLWINGSLMNDEIVVPYLKGHECNLSDEISRVLSNYPLIELWFDYIRHRNKIYSIWRNRIFRIPKNPKFDAWRLRRIAATRSELGFFGYNIDHPMLAFELGDGCSMNCWFCGFSSKKLTRNFDYAEGRDLFRRVAEACVDLFGGDPASMALLYYGTEPHDNPNYLDFVQDYEKITGHPVCTATAFVTDAEWMRKLIQYYRAGNYPWPRLSVLSKAMLKKIHDLYTPDELRDVELLMQMKDHCRPKITSGRIAEEQAGFRQIENGQWEDCVVPQGSIACVSGFLINMVNQTIQLVSPCYTSTRWPCGYRVFDEATFEDAEHFHTVICKMIETNMPPAPRPDMPARFRDDLIYRNTGAGFDLISPNQFHHFQGNDVYNMTGSLIAEGQWTYDQVMGRVDSIYPGSIMTVVAIIKSLYDDGFLDEVRANSDFVSVMNDDPPCKIVCS